MQYISVRNTDAFEKNKVLMYKQYIMRIVAVLGLRHLSRGREALVAHCENGCGQELPQDFSIEYPTQKAPFQYMGRQVLHKVMNVVVVGLPILMVDLGSPLDK